MELDNIRVVAFDADDTLWVNEPIYRGVEKRLVDMLSSYMKREEIVKRLFATEIRNLSFFGYGIKGFVLSMIETAVEISGGKIPGSQIQEIIDMGKEMLDHPVELLEGVEEVLQQLKGPYQLMVITKGDLLDQECKIARSNLSGYFDHIEILSEKDEQAYSHVLSRHGIPENEFLMVGNSIKSDILPVVNIGAKAIHIPYDTTWQHEVVNLEKEKTPPYLELRRMKEILSLLETGPQN